MQIKKFFKVSVATFILSMLAGCQTAPQTTVQTQSQTQVMTPTGQSTSTVKITSSLNLTGMTQVANENVPVVDAATMTQQKSVSAKPKGKTK